jgi:hypothetical protein
VISAFLAFRLTGRGDKHLFKRLLWVGLAAGTAIGTCVLAAMAS